MSNPYVFIGIIITSPPPPLLIRPVHRILVSFHGQQLEVHLLFQKAEEIVEVSKLSINRKIAQRLHSNYLRPV